MLGSGSFNLTHVICATMTHEQKQSSSNPNVLSVTHWTDGLFSFTITRPDWFRFEAGQFVMIGLPDDAGKPILRAYSVASPTWADHIEFLSIAVPDGPLTSRLRHIRVGDEILLGNKPTGTLVHSALTPGKRLFLIGTGTGLAPWMSIIREPETYTRFEHVYLCHGVRHVNELAYRDYLSEGIFQDEMVNFALENVGIGDGLKPRLTYYATVTREPFDHQGRITDQITNGALFEALGLKQSQFNPEIDRVMICGSLPFNTDMEAICEAHGLNEGATNRPDSYVVERAFAEKKVKPAA